MIQDRKDIPATLIKPDWYCVEIGVHLGEYSECILKNSKCRFLASVDPWEPCPGIIDTLEQGDKYYDYVIRRLSLYNLPNPDFKWMDKTYRSQVYRMTGQRFAEVIEDFHPNFVYIDSSHLYQETKEELELWWPKIADGGILAGHDYINGAEVRQAVDEFANANCLTLEATVNDSGWSHPVNSWMLFK